MTAAAAAVVVCDTGDRVYGVPMTGEASDVVVNTDPDADREAAATYYREAGLAAPAYNEAEGTVMAPSSAKFKNV